MKIRSLTRQKPPVHILLTLGAILCFPAISSAQGLDAGIYAEELGGHHGGMRHRGPRGDRGPRLSPEERVERRIARMTQELSLTPNQARRIRSILSQTAAQMQRLRPQRGATPDGTRSRSERREARRAFRERTRGLRWETQDRVHAVLSSEQRETLRRVRRQRSFERREARQQRRGERRERRGRGGPMRGGR